MPNGISKANRRCLTAIELMHKAGIAPEPRNYELFYLYTSDTDRDLIRAIDAVIGAGGTLDQGKADMLYEAHIGSKASSRVLEQMGDRLNTQITEAMGLVSDAVESTTSFGSSVGEAGSRLVDISDPVKLAAVVEGLVQATESMGHTSLELSQRLKASSEEIQTLKADLAQVRQDSQIDALTGIGNRRYLDSVLAAEISRARNRGQQMSFCLLDIDHFKAFNDTYGHTAGDAALRCVATLMQDRVRDADLVARFGGEEFAIILPETGTEEAAIVVDRIRAALGEKKIVKRSTGQSMGTVTASFGIAQLEDDDTMEALIERADTALYAAKNAGRNRVEVDRGDKASSHRVRAAVHAA